MWNEEKGRPEWRAAYDKFRAKGLSFSRAVEEASRTSPGIGAGDVQVTASGKKRGVKRAGAKPVAGSGGGVNPPSEVKPVGREGRGQGKTKRGSKMRKATLKGDSSRIGQVAVKRAWAAARKAAGEARWSAMTKEQKLDATLRRVGPMTGEEAIGAVRAIGSRVLPLTGSNDDVTKMINDWAKSQGVKAPKTELKIGAKAKADGKTGKETARLGGKGAKAPAGPEKPVEEKSPLGKKAKRIVRRRNRLDEILRVGEKENSVRQEITRKPTPFTGEFKDKIGTLTVAGKTFNSEYIIESASQAFIDANRKISEKNKIAIGKGVATSDLAPKYKVKDFVDAAYPNLGKADRSTLISGIRRAFRGERKVRKTTRAAAKEARVIELRGETVEEGRKKANAKDERVAKAKSAPLEKVKLESKAEGKRRARRVKTVGETISAVMDPSRSTPSAERMEPAPKQANRIFTPKEPGSELEMEMSKLRDSLNPDEKRTFKKIKEVARLGFTKAQVKERAIAGAFGKITPKVRKIAKRGGYLGIVATALQFLQDTKPGKN